MVSTQDSESCDPSSNLGRTCSFSPVQQCIFCMNEASVTYNIWEVCLTKISQLPTCLSSTRVGLTSYLNPENLGDLMHSRPLGPYDSSHPTVHDLETCPSFGPTVAARPCGPTDKASDYESGDCRFESCQGQSNFVLRNCPSRQCPKEKTCSAPPGGLEPPTFRLTAERASQLRHGGSACLPVALARQEQD